MTWVDFHMHTDASEDSDAPLRSMCDAAVAKGLCAVAVTDHLEMVDYEDYVGTLVKSWRDSGEAVPAYAGRLRIARGIEPGEPLADLKRTEAILDAYDFDFVLGSQHKLNSLDRETNIDYYFYDYTGKDVGLVMDEYFDAVLELVNWGRFHALAHLTYPFRYIPEEKRPADFSRWQDRIDAILRQLAVKGLALEINTSGLRQPAKETLPSLEIVKFYRSLGGEILTVGSDAHCIKDVAADLDAAREVAKEAGFRYLASFEKRKPSFYAIG